jgi:hypothetical protein
LRGEDRRGPADEYEALQARLFTALRRHPGDTRVLLQIAGALSRMTVAEGRLSPKKKQQLSDNLAAVLERFGDIILPEDGPPGSR